MNVPTLPEQHAIVTHFPVALLITGILFDLLASVARKPAWRTVGFWLLVIGALMTIPSVVTGWMTFGSLFAGTKAPVIAGQHRLMALVTTALAVILMVLRVVDGDKATGWTRGLHLLTGVVAALAVGVTGHLGGQLVFHADTGPLEAAAVTQSQPRENATAPADATAATADDKAAKPDNQAFTPPPALVAEGERLFWSDSVGCRDCHRIGDRGGLTGPNLTKVGVSRPDVLWHVRHLEDPASVVPGSTMPRLDKLTPLEREKLAMYLVSLR